MQTCQIMNKLISANYWFGCDWVFYEAGYLGLCAGQLSLACAVVYLWNTGYLRVTRPRLYPRIQHTGFLVYLNSALVYWSSKKQTSVELSSLGSEFIAMKQCCEYIHGLRYKLRMMGILVEGPAYIHGDNQSV